MFCERLMAGRSSDRDFGTGRQGIRGLSGHGTHEAARKNSAVVFLEHETASIFTKAPPLLRRQCAQS